MNTLQNIAMLLVNRVILKLCSQNWLNNYLTCLLSSLFTFLPASSRLIWRNTNFCNEAIHAVSKSN